MRDRNFTVQFVFSERSGLINALNPLFSPQLVVAVKGKNDSAIARPRRPVSSLGIDSRISRRETDQCNDVFLQAPKDSELVLPVVIYFQARLPSPGSLTKEDFKNAIIAISHAFHKLHPTLTKAAKDWEVSVLKAGRDVGGTRWNFRSSRSRVMRWKLIVVGEKVRTGERLPNVEVVSPDFLPH